MRRTLFAIVTAGVVFTAAPAQAQTQEFYPPDGTGVLCAISDLTPIANQVVRIESARAFAPLQEVSVFIGAGSERTLLGNLRADEFGSVAGSLTVPADAGVGRRIIQVAGGDAVAAPATCTIPVSVLGDTVARGGIGGAGLAFTGANIARWIAAAGLLIGTGATLKAVERRRRTAHAVVA